MTNTKQKLVDYREGSFVDFEGKDHYFVVCAVLRESTISENPTRILCCVYLPDYRKILQN